MTRRLHDLVHDVDWRAIEEAMTPEEREESLIPWEEVRARLEEGLER